MSVGQKTRKLSSLIRQKAIWGIGIMSPYPPFNVSTKYELMLLTSEGRKLR